MGRGSRAADTAASGLIGRALGALADAIPDRRQAQRRATARRQGAGTARIIAAVQHLERLDAPDWYRTRVNGLQTELLDDIHRELRSFRARAGAASLAETLPEIAEQADNRVPGVGHEAFALASNLAAAASFDPRVRDAVGNLLRSTWGNAAQTRVLETVDAASRGQSTPSERMWTSLTGPDRHSAAVRERLYSEQVIRPSVARAVCLAALGHALGRAVDLDDPVHAAAFQRWADELGQEPDRRRGPHPWPRQYAADAARWLDPAYPRNIYQHFLAAPPTAEQVFDCQAQYELLTRRLIDEAVADCQSLGR